MIYDIDGEYFVKVQGYFKQVEVTFDSKGNPDVKVKTDGKKLETYSVKNFSTITLDTIRERQKNSNSESNNGSRFNRL